MTKHGTPTERPPSTVPRGAGNAAQTASVPPSTARAPEGYREAMSTITDPVELEAARVRSTFTSPPPPGHDPSAEERIAAYERRFAGFHRVPSIIVPPDQLAALSLDGRATMLLGLLDGQSSIQAILDIGIFNATDALAGLQQLLELGVITMK